MTYQRVMLHRDLSSTPSCATLAIAISQHQILMLRAVSRLPHIMAAENQKRDIVIIGMLCENALFDVDDFG